MSDLASLFDAAEQAAVGGDFAAAARLLADAARIQEAALGPHHLDLANTLNNLAVAHERSGRLDDAEREYRRAHAIAARALPADDPLVTTSAQNLREFCQANGRPVDPPALRLAADEDLGAAATVVLARPPQADIPTAPIEPLAMTFAAEPTVPATRPTVSAATPTVPAPKPTLKPSATPTPAPAPPSPRPAAKPMTASPAEPVAAPRSRLSIPLLAALGAAAALVIWLLAGRGPAAPPARPEAAAPDAPPAAGPAIVAPAPGVAAPATTSPAPAATAADGLTVDEARLCTTLSASYQCQAAGATVGAGRLTFYTRLVARANTSVVHRWYRGSELRQAVRLDVPARRQGFRTFSRATVSPTEGEWRVELRSRDGRLLHVERFTVR